MPTLLILKYPGGHRATFGDPGVARVAAAESYDGREVARVKISVAGKGLIVSM